MNKLHIEFCKTVFRKDDFKVDPTNPKLTWEAECRRLGIPKGAVEFTANVTYGYVEGCEDDVYSSSHAFDILNTICGGTDAYIVRKAPVYSDDVKPWFRLTLSLKKHPKGLAEYSDVEFHRFDGCPSAVSEAAMEIRSVIKGLIRKARKQTFLSPTGVVTPSKR